MLRNRRRASKKKITMVPSLVLGMFLLSLVFQYVFASNVTAATQTVTLLFFDRDGNSMSVNQIRSTSNNGAAGFNNDALVDPITLRAITINPLFSKSGKLAFNLPSQPVALAFNWPTSPNGYSLIILDNEGMGFSTSTTVNFTYQAALDIKKKLDAALTTRPDYVKSAAFNTAYSSAESSINTAINSSSEETKGKYGQLALDQLAVAYDTMLAEYGPAYAKANRGTTTPWIGVTLDATDNYKANIDLAASISNPYGWIRVVFDYGQGPSYYSAMINYAKSKGLKILGQPVDSTYDVNYTRSEYLQRFKDFVAAFPAIDAWEVGNEVNGDWLSSTIGDKISDAADYIHNVAKKKAVLTVFWQINTSDKTDFSMFNWVNKNLPISVKNNIDVVFISQYQEQAPVGVVFDQVMSRLRAEFPTQQIGLGELGYWISGQQYWWAYSKSDPNVAGRHAVAKQYYNASLGYQGSVGGVFWWNYITEFPNDPVMQETVRNLRDTLSN